MTRRWVKPPVAKRISAHIQAWEAAQRAEPPSPPENFPFVTISRQFGCQGAALGHRLAEILNERTRSPVPWVVYDHELLDKVAGELQLTREIIDSVDDRRRDEMSELFDAMIIKRVADAVVIRKLAEIVRSLALQGRVVLIGRGCYWTTRDLNMGLHVRLVAPTAWRVERFGRSRELSPAQAEKVVAEGQRQRQKYLQTFFAQDPGETIRHDLVIDNSRFRNDQMAQIVSAAVGARFG